MKRPLLAAVLLLGCSSMRADVVFTLGNHPQPHEANVLLKSGTSGTSVTGDIAGYSVLFSSSQTLLTPSSGQARVSADSEGSLLTNLSITLDGAEYGAIILNPFLGSCKDYVGGDATVTVDTLASNGLPDAPSIFNYALRKGQNFLTIVASNGESIVSTTIDAPDGFHDLRQLRISGAEALTAPVPDPVADSVPEPATITMLGLGVIGLGLVRMVRDDARRDANTPD